ncbi:hypothetical protein [Ammoniphilus sp. YIM 78166]|uniref:hypothetical protein n=1 Tax=Ammoniphilus sp. YIM 78166 TaxID=1644106 RepID=UPI00106F5FEC|nr:hypothetical protein [Ammoniphilus sp. YIM 78166]
MDSGESIVLPQDVEKRIIETELDVDNIIQKAAVFQKTKLTGNISFRFEQKADKDILDDFEMAQSVCFVLKYEYLPILERVEILEHNGKYYIGNMESVRHVINEYRSIIANQRDSIYYTRIHKLCREKLINNDASIGLKVTVLHEKEGDITQEFVRYLDERNKSIRFLLENSEFDYLYNGILQHSDHKYTSRFWDDYYSGKINHIFIKHSYILGYIKEYLYWHYKIINSLTFPKIGPI